MKRGYYVHGYDDAWGIAVVAATAKQAKKIAFASGEFPDTAWTDLRVWWMKDADITGLEEGILLNYRDGLLRRLYTYVEGKCDGCGDESCLRECNGKALCQACEENVQE